jgi:hypothetical protein
MGYTSEKAMDEIRTAERVATQRAVIFYLLAGVLVLSLVVTGDLGRDPLRLLPWATMIVLGAANLQSVGLMRSRRLRALLDDETTRDHRRLAVTCGFWAALAAGLAVATTAALVPIAAVLAARVIVTAALTAALIAFATLELRAAR